MCEHKNVVYVHYGVVENDLTYKASKIRCDNCKEVLFVSKPRQLEDAHEYIKNNIDKIETLKDLTYEEINEIYNIPDGFKF